MFTQKHHTYTVSTTLSRYSLSFLSEQEVEHLVQVLLLVSGDSDIAGGICYAGQDKAVLNLAVVQE